MWTWNGTEEEAWQRRRIPARAQMSPTRLSNYTIGTSGKCLLPLYWPQWPLQFTTSSMWNRRISLYVYDWHASTSGCWTHWKVAGYSSWLVQHVSRGLHYYHAKTTTNVWYTYVTNTDWWKWLPLGVWPKAKHWCPILPCGQTRPKYTAINYPARMCAWVRHPFWRMACICDFECPWFWSLHREPSASVCESSNRSVYPSHRT